MKTIHAAGTWTGSWVAERLDVSMEGSGPEDGLAVGDLTGLALRRNPRRAHLLVSHVLGKHLPVRPAVAIAAARALGRSVAVALDPTVRPVPLECLRAGLLGAGDLEIADAPVPVGLVLGYAETATALGHLVADVLRARYLHSTRRPVAGHAVAGGFEETHSHATAHLLAPDDPALLDADGPIVLVDDELTTGATALGTIAALQERRRRARYVIATLVDVRDAADRAAIDREAERLGCTIDVVALTTGRLRLPPDVLARGAALVAAVPAAPTDARPSTAERVVVPLPAVEGGRHGFGEQDRETWRQLLPAAADALAGVLSGVGRIHLLGTEEFMAMPLVVAAALQQRLPDAMITSSSTTRSPVAAIDADGYAIRDAVTFPAHDEPTDEPRFAYNLRTVAPDVLVVMTDRGGDNPRVAGLLDAVERVADRVLLAVPGDPA